MNEMKHSKGLPKLINQIKLIIINSLTWLALSGALTDKCAVNAFEACWFLVHDIQLNKQI